MPVKNANQVKGRLKLVVNTIEKKALQFINAVGADAGILSKSKAPLEYGNLHNSQSFDVRQVGARIVGTLSYNTNYAAILNDGKYKWKPRPPEQKAGPAWNPDAEPMFLEYGFESDEAIANREKLLRIMKL